MDLLIATHRHLVEGWVLVVLLNLFLPLALRKETSRRILWTRIGFFAFWALWSMVSFSGVIVYLFAGHPHTLAVFAMIAAAVIVPFLDAYRAIVLGKRWKSGREDRSFSLQIVAFELFLLTGVMILAIVR